VLESAPSDLSLELCAGLLTIGHDERLRDRESMITSLKRSRPE
jgi:hypothetical protein